ncbi:MAG: DUF3011 domain-containing protein [Gammaproteobacteria bacterium]
MFRASSRFSAVFLAMAAVSLLDSHVAIAQTTNTITCSSDDGEYHRCEANTQGKVKLLRRLSWVSCEQGKSWGFDPRGIWVDQGCSAEFSYGAASAAASSNTSNSNTTNARTLTCESRNAQYNYCQAQTQGSVQLRRRLSSAECIEGDSWGYDSSGIWVSDNCRAEFAYGKAPTSAVGNQNNSTAAKPAGSLTCESTGGARKTCAANTQGKVKLTRQISRTACVQNQTWGYDNAGIWVSGGCRAQFAYGIAQQSTMNTVNSSDANAAAATSSTMRVTCESVGQEGKRCKIGDTSKASVRLVQQLSRTACTQDDTWGVDNYSLWVTGGCRGVFEVTTRSAAGSTSSVGSTSNNGWNDPNAATDANGDSSSSSVGATSNAAIPSWLVGTFNGYNPLYDAGMQITINQSGKVQATVQGTKLSGWYEEGKMVLGGVEYTVRRDQNGFRTIQDNDPGNQVIYTRAR